MHACVSGGCLVLLRSNVMHNPFLSSMHATVQLIVAIHSLNSDTVQVKYSLFELCTRGGHLNHMAKQWFPGLYPVAIAVLPGC